MKLHHPLFGLLALSVAAICSAAGSPAIAPSDPAAPVVSATAVEAPGAAFDRLQGAAVRLQDSIRALKGKPLGAERESALQAARQALLETRAAMLALPPDLRPRESASMLDYDGTVRELMKTAGMLRHSIQSLATQPAGPLRNQAIADANRALAATQVAMVNAYDIELRQKDSQMASGRR